MLKVYDYQCPNCDTVYENHLTDDNEEVLCEHCCGDNGKPAVLERLMSAPKILTTIVPTYPGSKALKAGHMHRFGNRPAEKTQVGFGGSVSTDHPTGGGKPQS